MGDLTVRCRAAGVLLGLVATWPAVLWLVGPAIKFTPDTVDSALAWALGLLLLSCWTWLSLVGGLMALEAAATGTTTLTARLAPHGLRLLVAVACGAGVVGGVTAPASADPVDHATAELHVLDGLALPDRPVAPRERPSPVATSVVVRSGDTLWSLAERLDIDWQQLYRTNRAVIGSDPDLIHPGTRLTVPSHTRTEGAHR